MRALSTTLLVFALFSRCGAAAVETAEFRQVIAAYYYAIGESRMEEAMSVYHEDSPEADRTRRELEFARSAYLQRTSTLSLDLVSRDGALVVVHATHRHLRISGIKFMEEFTKTRYVLRHTGDGWKIWSSVGRPWRRTSPDDRPGVMGAPAEMRTAERRRRAAR